MLHKLRSREFLCYANLDARVTVLHKLNSHELLCYEKSADKLLHNVLSELWSSCAVAEFHA